MKNLNQKGQGMTEYILIVALIAITVLAAVKLLGRNVNTGFSNAAKGLGTAVNDAGTGNKILP